MLVNTIHIHPEWLPLFDDFFIVEKKYFLFYESYLAGEYIILLLLCSRHINA